MSNGAICSYSFLATVPLGGTSIVVAMSTLGIPLPPQGGFLRRINVKSVTAPLTGGNYDVTLWATDSAVPANLANYEVFRQVNIVPTGVAAPRVDLNATPDSPYSMQIVPAVGIAADMQIEIDIGGPGEAADRDFRVVLEIQGAQTPASPTLSVTQHFPDAGF